MFKVAEEPRFTHKVKVRVPIDGGFKDEEFKATFRAIAPEEASSFDLATTEGSTDFLRRIIVSLDDIADAEGKQIEFSDEVLTAVLRLPWARRPLAQAYFDALSGAKAGN